MDKAYSEDLRSRVIKNYLNGMSKINIITYFEIGMDTLNRWIRQNLNVSSLKPKQRTQYRARKFSDSDLINYIHHNPSATLAEMARHCSVKPSSVQARLKALSITYKKSFLYKERDEQKRNEFIKQLEQNESRCDKESQPVVYIDECGIHDHIRNEYGWSMKGEIILDDKKVNPPKN